MKRLIVCCDGTWNTPDSPAPTNVVRMARAIDPRDEQGVEQVVYYDDGIGTGGPIDRLVGGATGKGLMHNVGDAYRFLVWNYEPGDEIWLFGFSRGAYTVRSLGGLIRKCGILRKTQNGRFEEAYKFYRSEVVPSDPVAAAFRARNSVEAHVRFLGVWDTVGALGIPGRFRWLTAGRHQFHDVKLSSTVERAYQAVAIDERRKAFEPALWETDPKAAKNGQVVEQVWFAGVHSDVGGGYEERGLADGAFLWMAKRAQAAGLSLDATYLKGFAPDPNGALHDSRSGIMRLLPARSRTIGAPENQPQDVDGSALARHKDPSRKYAPQNLVEYLARR